MFARAIEFFCYVLVVLFHTHTRARAYTLGMNRHISVNRSFCVMESVFGIIFARSRSLYLFFLLAFILQLLFSTPCNPRRPVHIAIWTADSLRISSRMIHFRFLFCFQLLIGLASAGAQVLLNFHFCLRTSRSHLKCHDFFGQVLQMVMFAKRP